jgi:putative sterol carrier protein
MTTAREVIAGMKDHFESGRAAGLTAAVAYELTGEGGGAWTLRVEKGQLQVDEGLPSGAVSATVTMAADDFVKVAAGELNPMTAFMAGKIRIAGDPFMAQRFQTLFRQP